MKQSDGTVTAEKKDKKSFVNFQTHLGKVQLYLCVEASNFTNFNNDLVNNDEFLKIRKKRKE